MEAGKDRQKSVRDWYDSIFRGCSGETLPVRDGEDTAGGWAVEAYCGAADIAAIRGYCRRHDLDADAFFTAAFGLALSSYTSSEQAIFEVSCGDYVKKDCGAAEDGAALSGGILPVSLSPEGAQRTEAYIRGCQAFLLEARRNGAPEAPEIGESYDLRRRILFSGPGEAASGASGEGARRERKAAAPTEETLLAVSVSVTKQGILYAGGHASAAYSEYTVCGLLRLTDHIAAEMTCRETLKDITLVSAEDESEIASLHDTAWPVRERPAYRLLEDSAKKYPQRTALIASDRTLTYRELNEEANALGHSLREAGAKTDTVVAVLAERNSWAYVMRQGVLKSGGAFLPVDPEYPEDRISYILEDSGAKLLVTTGAVLEKRRAFFDRLSGAGIRIMDAADAVRRGDRRNPDLPVPPEALAYVIYTSGSTGKPKGVMLMNRNLVNFVDDNEKNREIQGYTKRGHVSLAIAALTFDVSIMEEFIPLSSGMTSVLATRAEIMDPPALAETMLRHQVDLMTCTPSYMLNLLEMARLVPGLKDAFSRVKSIDLGAEAFPPALYEKLREVNPELYIMNGYGPTEATISCTMQVIESAGNITIGIPNANVTVCTLDRQGRLQPLGALGEMVILGDGVGRGYIGRPDLNEKSFLRMLGKPAYRSGDLVRIRKDGSIAFHGRIDNQVKLRGLRVELGEIENVIASYPSVRSSAVLVFRQRTDYLAGYFTADEQVDTAALKAYLASSLTEYMVPQVLIQLPEMPLTANGKIDRKALPLPNSEKEEKDEAPATETESLICAKMALSLGMESVGVNDDFFEIGGSSITAIRLIMECHHPGVDMASIYQYRTPRALAAWCERAAGKDTADAENSAALKEALPLPANMKKYLQMQRSDPDSVYCNDAMLFRLREEIDPEAFTDAVNRVLRHHPVFYLRLVPSGDGEELRQVFDESAFRPVTLEEMSSEAFDSLRGKLVRPFQMVNSPLWESRIIRTETAAYFYISMHHIISDGYSFMVLFDQIHACYRHPEAVPEPDYYGFLMKQMAESASGAEGQEAEAFCRALYGKIDGIREADLALRTDHETADMPGAVRMETLDFPKEKLGGHIPLITACALAFCAYNGTDRALIRFVSEARSDLRRLNSVGLYANYYPVVLVKEEGATPKSLMDQIAGQVRFIDSHPDYPYFEGRISEPDRLMRFIYQKDIDDLGAFGEMVAEEIPLDTGNDTATDSLCGVSVFDSARMEAPLFLERYSKAHYEPESMDRLYKLFLEALSYLTIPASESN